MLSAAFIITVLISFFLLHLPQKKYLFIDFTPRENTGNHFFAQRSKVMDQKLVSPQDISDGQLQFCIIKAKWGILPSRVTQGSLTLDRSIIKNLCSYLFVLNRKQSLSSLLISLTEKALSGLHSNFSLVIRSSNRISIKSATETRSGAKCQSVVIYWSD